MSDSEDIPSTGPRPIERIAGTVVGIAFHLTAILVVFCLTLFPVFGGERFIALVETFQTPQFFEHALPTVGIHVLIAALLWGIGWGIWKLGRRRRNKPRLVVSKGTVITETLVVFPVLLLLILGMAQLAINSAVGMLANLAAYESARSVWVWNPERERFSGEVDEAYVEEKARIQAAAVFAPVAPPYGTGLTEGSEDFRDFRGAMVASQLPIFAQDAGGIGRDIADGSSALGRAYYGGRENAGSFARAFDATIYPVRSIMKLSGSYVSTDAEIVEEDVEGESHIGAHVTYRHFQAMPLVGRIFGDEDPSGERPGFFATYESTYLLRQQVVPHDAYPEYE